MTAPVWFITGVSNGLGLVLALHVLQAKSRVVGTVRSKARAADAVRQIEAVGGQVVEMDMTEPQQSIADKVRAAGPIDYLVNNAGFAILKACESFSADDAETQMQTNFLGPLYAIQAALPAMRARRGDSGSGLPVIVNVGSVAARDPLPTSGLYAASKAALAALSTSLAREVAPLGVRVLLVEPGAFRTNFIAATRQAVTVHSSESPLGGGSQTQPGRKEEEEEVEVMPADYRGTAAEHVLRRLDGQHGAQRGDPAKAAARLFEAATTIATGEEVAVEGGGAALLVLGEDALVRSRAAAERWLRDLNTQEAIAKSTDFS